MKPLAHVVFALLLAGLQAALLRWIGGGAVSVALLACCVVWAGLQAGNVDGAVAAAGIGYLLDLFAATPKGLMTFLAVALVLAVRAVSAAVDVRSRASFALLSGVAAIFLSLGALLLTRYTVAAEAAPGLILVPRMLVEGVLTAVLSPLVGLGLRRVDGLFHREEPGLLH